jgi:glutathione S-transferase
MKLYIAYDTCSRAAQLVANELGLNPELIHFDVKDKSTSKGDDFLKINPLAYVPALVVDNGDVLTETIVVTSYLADQHPEANLIPKPGTPKRAKFDALLVFTATEIAQKHIPLMRKLMTPFGMEWTLNKLISAYGVLDQMLSDGRKYLTGDQFTVADAYVWATMWQARSGARIDHYENLMAYIARIDERPSAKKTIKDEAALVEQHMSRAA